MSFVKYTNDDYVVSSEISVKNLWSNNQSQLTSFFTSSVITNSYYISVYNNVSTSSNQFDITYGNLYGTGSLPINLSVPENTPTRITYGQYRNLIYGNESSSFIFNNIVSEDFWVVNINRNLYKESIKPGSLNITLRSGSNVLKITDDSNDNSTVNFIGTNRYYTLVSGSNGNKVSNAINNPSGSYGYLFPDMGFFILNPKALSTPPASGGLSLTTGSNPNTSLFNAISGGGDFNLLSQETLSSIYFFTRIKNKDFNYTTNPSIIDDNGNLIYSNLINNPQTFMTTVGLYNDNNELLAVAKLNKPLKKDFTSEMLLQIKLNY